MIRLRRQPLPKMDDHLKRIMEFVRPEMDERLYESFRRNPQEDQARWNAFAMRDTIAQQGRNLVKVITEKVRYLESGLQPDEQLIVYCDAGRDRLRADAFEFPNWHLAIIAGLDDDNNRTYRIENVQDIKLTCKVVKSGQSGPKIGFVLPPEK